VIFDPLKVSKVAGSWVGRVVCVGEYVAIIVRLIKKDAF
jgi:hypothetical protein